VKRQLLSAARAAHLERQLRALHAAQARSRAWVRGRRRRLDPTVRRNARDERHLSVLLAAVLRRDSGTVDVGANMGDILGELMRLAPNGHHVAIEPLPELAARLSERYPTADVHAVALSNHRGRASFVRVPDAPGLSGFGDGKADGMRRERISVAIEPLDDLLPEGFAPDLIKVDVEGAELQVFEGARRTLTEHQPVVVFEHSNRLAPQFGTRPAEVHRLLAASGLHVFDMDGEGPLSLAEFERVVDTHSRFNFFACPG
jgi:FkbM family methyltransferase